MSSPVRRGRGVPAGLSSQDIVEVAERVIDRVGFDALSLRLVALELGVTPGALYHHFPSKQHLLAAVADDVLRREVLDALPTQLAPLERVRLLCRRMHDTGMRHPRLVVLTGGHLSHDPASPQPALAEVMMSALIDTGVDPARAGVLYRVLTTMSLGSAITDANLSDLGPEELESRIDELAANPTYPVFASYLHTLRRPVQGTGFDGQLDLVLSLISVAGEAR